MAYTYLIGWSKHNRYYYGARWAKNCAPDDLWKTYFTSSKHVKQFRKQHGEPDIIEVRKIFDDIEKCRKYEKTVLTRLNVLNEEKWLNKNINGSYLPYGKQTEEHIKKRTAKTTGPGNGMFGKKLTLETIQKSLNKKIINGTTGKGVAKSLEHKANMIYHTNNSSNIQCPHCNKIGQFTNMKRWHFDRCKNNENAKKDLEKIVTCIKCGHTAKASANFYRYHNEHCSHDQSAL